VVLARMLMDLVDLIESIGYEVKWREGTGGPYAWLLDTIGGEVIE
jgi:hypothetical protein